MITEVVGQTIMITSFVMVMMLLIEYLNVRTRGLLSRNIRHSGWFQIILSIILGIIPGCLGSYAAVSMYTHNMLSLGAVTATMIATTGDESFLMLSMFPGTYFKLNLILIAVAFGSAILVNAVAGKKKYLNRNNVHFYIHDHNNCSVAPGNQIWKQMRQISFERAIILFGLALYLFALLSGKLEHGHTGEIHDHENNLNWITITFFVVSLMTFIIIVIVPDHFLKDHLWGHIIKKHFLKIFLWTFGALFLIELLLNYFDFDVWLKENQLAIMFAALIIGLIPVSGPHIVFVTLFFNHTIPFSVLLTNSIVQDGHGMIPLLAESKKSFFLIKGVNLIVGLIVGVAGYLLNW